MSELEEFKRVIEFKAIHRKVLVIANTRAEGKWKARVHLIPGVDSHEKEAQDAFDKGQGSALSEVHARAFFPNKPFSDMKYAK